MLVIVAVIVIALEHYRVVIGLYSVNSYFSSTD